MHFCRFGLTIRRNGAPFCGACVRFRAFVIFGAPRVCYARIRASSCLFVRFRVLLCVFVCFRVLSCVIVCYPCVVVCFRVFSCVFVCRRRVFSVC